MSSLSLVLHGAAREAVDTQVPGLVDHEFASRLAAKDHTLWGPAAEEEAAKRLGWVDLFEDSRALIPRIEALREDLTADGVDRVVLAGMGGSSLAPEVICAVHGVELVVLDSTDPQHVGSVVGEDIERTVLVVSSKSGSTVETDSQHRIVSAAFSRAGIDPSSRTVVVTDPGSPLAQSAAEAGVRAIFEADPTVGGRYSALTAFGLVPSGLAGAELQTLIEEAEDAAAVLAEDDPANPGLQLGAALGGTRPLRNKLVLTDQGSPLIGLGAWIEQLVAESTGKDGTGVLPVLVGDGEPELHRGDADVLIVALVDPDEEELEDGTITSGHLVRTGGSLGAQFLLWEVATAVAGSLLGINPFDQPDVESAKAAARGLLDAPAGEAGAALRDGAVEIRVTGGAPAADSVTQALRGLLTEIPAAGYLAVMAYLDRTSEQRLEAVRAQLSAAAGRPVTFGWGPRFLHSTGQFHKGGPAVGAFLQISAARTEEGDLDVPERPFTLARLITAQAEGDAAVLAEAGMPVLSLSLRDRAAGLAQILDAVDEIAG